MKTPLTFLTALVLTASTYAADPAKGALEPTNAAEAAAKKAAEDAATDAQYQALVAKLPPDQQAWERILEQNLGNGFYLPIHKRSRVKGQSTCWDFVQEDPKLPRVLLIGDSVSGGYTLATRKALAGKANLHKAPENCGPTANGLKKLDIWLNSAPPAGAATGSPAAAQWDVIHFNFGIHDRNTPPADYEKRLEEIIVRLKATGAKLIWASTTPIPTDAAKKQTAESIVERNVIAARLMQKHGIVIDDLFAFITPHLATAQNPNDVHFNGPGYQMLGNQVAASIEPLLTGRR
jgi:lysophospholipase L1-like esterase